MSIDGFVMEICASRTSRQGSMSLCPSAMLPAGQAEPATIRHASQTNSSLPQPPQRRRRRLVKGPRPASDGAEDGMPAAKRRLPASVPAADRPSGIEQLLQEASTNVAKPSQARRTGRYTILSMV